MHPDPSMDHKGIHITDIDSNNSFGKKWEMEPDKHKREFDYDVPLHGKGFSGYMPKKHDKMTYNDYSNLVKKHSTNEAIDESKMAELHATLGDHLDKHIAAYKEGKMGADTLGDKVASAHPHIAKAAGIPLEHAKKFANEYVDGKLAPKRPSFGAYSKAPWL